ncbi:MAG: ATP-binding cassette domain-containing protein [Bacteroidales bacterium]|nr:ATP-binding cassette domain-containing protein [Bacteroidales bacterium]MCF8455005.1 ATP-binding cassette domain-containing protein [Bacteroidales bacterium]
MEQTLEIRELSKRFGKIQAVNKLDLKVLPGQVYGILGPNGSGKTTTLGMILEVVAPDSGIFRWFDNVSNVEARKKIGSILETPSFYPYLTAVQNLKIVAHIKQCSTDRIEPVLKMVGLHDRKDDKFKAYSLGMKQRLSIGAALLSDPPVLILDEPTNGLDPEGIAEVRALIKDIAAQGKTIIMASHLLDEVQKVCTHFCILRKGVKLHEGLVEDTLGEINRIEVSHENLDHLEDVLANFEGLETIRKNTTSLHLSLKENYNATHVNAFCFEKDIVLRKLVTHTNSLEQEFLKILKEHD